MTFIFYGKICKSKKKEIEGLIVSNLRRLTSAEIVGKHYLQYYNVLFVQADAKNAQGKDVILLDLRFQPVSSCREYFLKPFREDELFCIMETAGS